MKSSEIEKGGTIFSCIVAVTLSLTTIVAHAAPGVLAQSPLFLAHPVQPNILLILDDSGSMDWEVLMSGGARMVHPAGVENHPNLADDPDFYDQGNLTFKIAADDDQERNNLEHCAGYNVMAYDPGKIYTPWYGKDKDGVEFTDQLITAARVNPYTGGDSSESCTYQKDANPDKNAEKLEEWVNNSNGIVCDLTKITNDGAVKNKTGAFYYIWHDRNEDGVYQEGECSTDESVEYRAQDRIYVVDLPADKKTNYANWFSYYRKREYVMKRAVSQIIAESRDRLGLATINNRNHVTLKKGVGTQIKDVDDLTLPLKENTHSNKVKLLDNLLGVDCGSGTPLRKTLGYAGLYFKGEMKSDLLFGYTPEADPESANGNSPILSAEKGGTCQQNFAILLSDGYWKEEIDANYPAGNADKAEGAVDEDGNRVKDSDGNTVYVKGFDGQSYADEYSNTLADFAMQYYETDLMPNLANEVPAVSIYPGADTEQTCFGDDNKTKLQNCYDINNMQHMVTFTVSFGVVGTIPEKYPDGRECYPGNRHQDLETQNWPKKCGADYNGWPEVIPNESTTADDMKHAAWNGRGKYLNAKTPDDLILQLQQAIGMISQRSTVSASAAAVDTYNVINGGKAYQGRFDSASWSGQLFAHNVTVTNNVANITDQLWAAHDLLDAMAINERILVSYNGYQGVTFEFPDNYTSLETTDLSQAQINDLLYDAPNPISTEDATEITANQTYGEQLLNYLRGDRSNEGTKSTEFRKREHRLGDIIHSSPVYVGDPDPTIYPRTISPDTAPYSHWASTSANLADLADDETPGAKGRQAMVYVGANDGALHAFDAATGIEKFAYFPQAVFSDKEQKGLHWLANPAYEHRYYVDMEPAVGEVYVNTGTNGDNDGLTWRTLLVGGLRGGGRAMYAIDVSDPTEFSDATGVAGNILWEFTHPDLGYTYSKPTIAKLNNGRWAAIFGNGYNQTGADATGKAALFIKYLDNGDSAPHVIYAGEGTITNGDCLHADSSCNGLATPAVVDLGADRVADRVYAGDIKGNMWAFDISSKDSAEWKVAYGDVLSPLPLFKATDGTTAQPITSQPMVTQHPTKRHSDTSPNTMVFFGTGQYMVKGDLGNKGANTFYAIWDAGVPVTLDRSENSPVLVEQTVGDELSYLSGKGVRLMTNNPVNYGEHKGWFFDLPDSGERIIVNPLVFGDLIIYTTMVPYSNLCSDNTGYSWLMAHNLADGSEPDFIALDVTGEGVFSSGDQVGDHNVSGVKSDDIYWQPTAVKSGPGALGTLLLPTDGKGSGITEFKIQGAINKRSRSSWGLFRND